MSKLDSLGRRKRLEPTSTGKRIRLTERDLLWLQCLATHGPLASSFLLEFARDMGQSEKRARERLADLFHEDNTPDGAPYLIRPPQQFHTLDSRYSQLVYDLSGAGRRAIKKAGLPNVKLGGPWLHSFMVSSVTASLQLAISKRPDLKYISQTDILARAKAELAIKIRLPSLTSPSKLIPDSLFGIEYIAPKGSQFRFFVVEADRSTEPLTSKNLNRKSAVKALESYRAYIGDGLYRKHLNLTSPLLVLNVFNDELRARKVMDLYERQIPGGLNYQLFQSWKEFAPPFRPPKPNESFLVGAWQRAGKSPIFIDQP